MSNLKLFDRQMLDVAFSEIDAVRRSLPKGALNALAQEVVGRVATQLHAPCPETDFIPDFNEIDVLCDALLSEDASAATAFIDNLRMRGVSYETVCLRYLTVAARRLGERWDNDEITFYPVTIGAGRIYAILRILRLSRPNPIPSARRVAAFAAVPGETHTLGISIATDLARERGWDVDLILGLPHESLVEEIAQRQPPLVGLSASGRRSLPALIRLIVALRISNPDAHILVCGQITATSHSLVGVSGADAVAESFDEAIAAMERLLKLPKDLQA